MISAHDASAQVAAEHQLSDALSLLTATLDSTADGILVVDNDGAITGFNRRFSEIWRIAHELRDDRRRLHQARVRPRPAAQPADLPGPAQGAASKPENESFDTLEFKDGRAARADLEAADGGRHHRRSGLELPRRHRSHPAGGRARIPGLPRLPDRTGQQGAVPGPPRARPGPDRPDRLPPGRALHRPRRLQDGERQPGARRRGPAAQAGGDDALRAACGLSTPRRVSAGTSSPSSSRTCGPARTSRPWPERILESLRLAVPQRSPIRHLGRQHRHRVRRARHHAANSCSATRTSPCTRRRRAARTASRSTAKEMHAAVLARVEQERELRAAIHDGDLLTHYQPIYDLDTRRDHRLRGARAVGAPDRRSGRPASVRPAGRGAGADRRDRLLRAAIGLHRRRASGTSRASGTRAWS